MGLFRLAYDLYTNGPHVVSNDSGSQSPNAFILGGGTNVDPISGGTVADKNFIDFRFKSAAPSGTTRGVYNRLALTGGAGGECARFLTRVESNTPADTCNGAHISLDFGDTVGNITGLGTAARHTLHIPGRSIGGTISPVMAEFYGDAASGAIGGLASFLRCVVDGHANLKTSFDDSGYLFDISGVAAGAVHLWRTGLTVATLAAATSCALRINIGGTAYYIPVATATA